jgi:hypothetical protein
VERGDQLRLALAVREVVQEAASPQRKGLASHRDLLLRVRLEFEV